MLATVLVNIFLVGNIGDSEDVLAEEADGETCNTLLTHKHTVSDLQSASTSRPSTTWLCVDASWACSPWGHVFGDSDIKTKDKPFVSIVP